MVIKMNQSYGIVSTPTLFKIIELADSNPYYLDFYRLLNIEDVIGMTKDIEGSIVEIGTGLGMSLAMFYLLSKTIGVNRQLWSYDSFEGLPEPHEEDLSSATSLAKKGALNYGGTKPVLDTLKKAKMGEDEIDHSVKLIKGWFKDTIPLYDGPPIAILHADADLYESTILALEHLWPKMAIGGIVIFDEYDNTKEWPREKKAADEYFSKIPNDVKLFRDRFGIRYNAIKLK